MVWGVSKDSIKSHQKFIEEKAINIPLLSDPDKKVIEAYGAWQLKKMYGKDSWGVVRSTVLINPEGKVAKVWSKVSKASGHAAKVLQELRSLIR